MPDNLPLVDRTGLETKFGGYQPMAAPADLPNIAYKGLDNPMPSISEDGQPAPSALDALERVALSARQSDKLMGGGISRSIAEVTSPRYKAFVPGDYNNEDAYAQGQGWTEKMVNDVGKGILLTGTTFLQSTIGLANGLARWAIDGRAASFYDNDMTRSIDEINKKAEDLLPNYYTDAENNAAWYSPTKIFTANFFWDGIIKNMGFAAGAMLSGGVFTKGLSSIPGLARLFSVGKAAEALAATEEGLLAANKVAETYGKVKGLSDKFLSSYKLLNPAGRAMVAGLSTTGEAGFEGYNNMTQFRDEKIQEYKDLHYGQEPTGAELNKINQLAESVGNSSFLLNVGLLTATNYIQFPKMLGSSYKAEKGMINSLTKEIGEITTDAAGNLIEKKAVTRFGKLLSGVNKVRPYLFSSSEGFEEGAQYAVQAGTQDYYDKKYKGDSASFLDSLSQGITQTLGTDEGMQNVLIGGLSGAMMQAKGTYSARKEKSENTVKFLEAVNKYKLSSFTKDTIDSINRGTVLQEERENHLRQGDILESKDAEADYIINYLTPRIKYGRFDLVTSDIADYKQLAMSDEGFAQLQAEGKALQSDTKEAFLQRLTNLESTANNMKSLYQSLNLRYGGLRTKDGKQPLYAPEVFDKMVYAATKVADYDNRLPGLAFQLLSSGIDTDTIAKDLLAGDSESYNVALAEIESSKGEKQDDNIQALQDFNELTLRRQMFLEEYDTIKKSPQEFKNDEVATEDQLAPPPLKEGETVPTVTIKTKTGDKEIEIGTEYFLGRVVGKDKNGKDVYRAPRLTVLGENEDGTIQIKDNNGVRNISKDEFEDYKLGKVSDTLSNKKAKFFMDNWNTVYEFNFGKGNKVKGRLEWSEKDRALTFVYLNKKGQRKEIEVTGDQFEAKEGFKEPMIKSVSQLTAVQQKAQEDLIEDAKTDPRVAAKREARLQILNDLFEELSKKQESTTKLIEQKRKQLENISKQLNDLREDIANAQVDNRSKKAIRFKAATKLALKSAIDLSRLQEQLEREVAALETERDELEFNASYVADLAQNIDELPQSFKDLKEELESQQLDLEILREANAKQITAISKLLKETERAFNSAVDFINDLITKFESKYPNVPRLMGQDWVDFLKTNPNFLKIKPNYREELAELEDIVGLTEDNDIVPSDKKIEALQEHLSIIQDELTDIQKELDAKKLIIDKFQEVADKYKAQKEEEQKLQRDENLIQQFIGTLGGYTQTQMEDKSYEASAKKDDVEVVTSTIGSSERDEKKPFNIRLKNFAFNFYKLANKDSLRGTIVTNKTQDSIIPGLTEHLMSGATEEQKAKYDHTKTIVLVITDEDGNPVDENGVTIPAGADLLNTAIYQVFPTEKLTAEYDGKVESMFRNTTDPKVEATLREQYAAWRAEQLEKTELSSPRSISRSFGIAEYSTTTDDKGKEKINYDSRNSVEGAGLVSSNDLLGSQVVTVATTNDSVTNGRVTFNTPLGGVFLKVKDGLYKLFNRKFNEKEATTIYDVIHQLAKNAVDEGKIGSESDNLIKWLKSVIYWGINKTEEGERKAAGYNSVWFETVNENGKRVPKLFISGKETDSTQQFDFTPSGLELRKADIILLLSNLYSNTDAKIVNNSAAYNNGYYQITGIDSEGKAITTRWPNYQSYLLSNKSPDANGDLTSPRTNEEIPLSTPVRQLNGEGDVNKKGFYFTLGGSSEFEMPTSTPEVVEEVAPVVPVTKPKFEVVGNEILYTEDGSVAKEYNTPEEAQADLKNWLKTEEAPAPVAEVVTAPKYVLDGATVNTVELAKNLGTIEFVADESSYNPETGTIKYNARAANQETENNLLAIFKTPEKVQEQILLKAYSTILPQLKEKELQNMAPEIVAAAPIETPVTETEVEVQDDRVAKALARAAKVKGRDKKAYRLKLAKESKQFTPEDWNKVEAFIKKALPTIPFYRVKNMIQATNGRQAWGMLHNGAIYVTENAEVGTAYHEVFEAIWKMFSSPQEKKAILDEFKNRKGSYVDRFTGETINYADATSDQIKEELAEEFRDFVMTGKTADRSQGKSFIERMFSDLVNFIKTFFTGEKALNNTQELFEKIGSGFYAQYNPYESKLSYANKGIIDVEDAEAGEGAEFRIKSIPAQQVIDIVENMTYETLAELSKNNQDLFNAADPTKKTELLARLKEETLDLISEQISIHQENIDTKEVTEEQGVRSIANALDLLDNVEKEWDNIVTRYEEKLKTFSIQFDENDNLLNTDEDNSGKSDYIDSRKIDDFRKSNAAIKLLFGTLANTTISKTGEIELAPSSIGGATLIPSDKVFITLKNALYDSLNVDEMFTRLKAIGKGNPNYAILYNRITRSDINDASIDFDKLQEHDLQLISAFYKAMKGQNADVLSVFILPNGQVVIGDSNLSQSSRQAKRELSNNLIASIKTDNPYVKYNSSTGKYNTATNNRGEKIIDGIRLSGAQLESYVNFLDKLGIKFDKKQLENKLNNSQLNTFREAVEGIKKSLSEVSDVVSLTNTTLKVDGRLLTLGSIQSIIENPEFESTYFNVNGERTQTYLGTNALSELYGVLSSIKNIKELQNTNYAYLLTDVFSKNEASVMLNKMFNVSTDGSRKEGTEDLMHPVYIDGTINEKVNKKKESSKLTIKERIVQEINLNISGVFMNLVPGDASIEWAIRMFKKEAPLVTKDDFDNGQHLKIFKNYFISEVNLAKDGRETAIAKNTNELRFFKDILGEDYKKVWNAESRKLEASEIYNKYQSVIDRAVNRFIEEEAEDTGDLLEVYGITSSVGDTVYVDDLAFTEDESMNGKELSDKLNLLAVNYVIANIEMHKLIYSDPYQYKDELKRIKNFNSPRQPLLNGSALLNSSLNKQYNKLFAKKDIGRTDMTREVFKSTVIADILSTNDLPGYEDPYEETDGGGYITAKANRIFGLRAGSWTSANEKQYRYDIAYEKIVKGEKLTDAEKKEQGLVLNENEKSFGIKKVTDKEGNVSYVGNNPNVKSTYTTRKPIVAGSKADGKNYNDIVLDKFALTPLSFRILHELNPDSNALRMYNKMQAEDVDYAVYNTGRKVGAGIATPLYKVGGEFNTDPFEEVNNIPFSIMGVQAEVPSKENAIVTQGSQVTKLVTLDFLQAGMPIDFEPSEKDFNKRFVKWMALTTPEAREAASPLYKEILNNQEILEAKILQGYETLLTKLGIEKSVDEEGNPAFKISNVDKLIKTLTDEILKREVNENIIEAFDQFKLNKGIILEATPAYQQIRNILYSIADKNITSQKISGGMKVQVSSALLESARATSKEVNGKQVYESNDLKFYKNKDGERVCEIMISRWFKSDMSDKELLEYLNKTDEGQKILSGIGFRIPTQKQNSIDVFKIKEFLPEGFGDNVIIPSALVKKTGSDFDIDKLSIYLKNIFTTGRGDIKIVPYFGIGESAKAKFGDMFDRGEFLTKEQIKELDRYVAETKERELDNTTAEYKLIRDIFPDAFTDEALEKEFIEDLVTNISKKGVRETIVEDMYKKSLENAYIESLEKLVSHPLNFDNLVKPNSAKELNDLSDEIVGLTGQKKIDYSAVGNMLSRRFMSQLRQDFVSGKYAIGIAATAQTNHADNQRALITIDRARLQSGFMSSVDKHWLGDGKINLPHNVIENKATLSMINNTEGKSISDIIGQFIDGFVDIAKGPWIMKLGATPNVAGTWLFLTKIGVPIRTTAYFMNQPIVRDYLRSIQSAGYSYLFMDLFVNNIQDAYNVQDDITVTNLPTEDELKKMLGKKSRELSPLQNAQQHFILEEFLKYAKMAEHLFKVQQATNFDTATLNDPYLIFKKQVQLARAKNTIISSVDDLLDSSFKNVLKDKIFDVRDAFAQVLLSDKKGRIRNVMQSVLLPYVDKSDKDFIKISQTAVNTLFDWAMLNAEDRSYNMVITRTLLGDDTEKSAARQIIEFRDQVAKNPNHPLYNNIVLKSIKMEAGSKTGKPDNLYIAGRDNKVYDQNLIIDAFRQIKETLGTENKDLYGKFVRVAVLQSGLTNSPISFTSLLPYEDFNNVYNVALSNLENLTNLGDFKKLNVFERTNWNNSDVVPVKAATLIKNKKGGMTNINEDFINQNLKNAMKNETINKVINISINSFEGNSDFMTYTWQSNTILDTRTGKFVPITKKLKDQARRKGDYSYIKKGLFQKVYIEIEDNVMVPLVQASEYNGKIYENYVYKMVNAWGDSYRANESYDYLRPSKLDNGYEKLAEETTDNDIVTIMATETFAKPSAEIASLTLKNGVSVAPSDLTQEVLETAGYKPAEVTRFLQKYNPSALIAETITEKPIKASTNDIVNALKENNIIDKNCN